MRNSEKIKDVAKVLTGTRLSTSHCLGSQNTG